MKNSIIRAKTVTKSKRHKGVRGNKATLLRSLYRVPGSVQEASLLIFKPYNL